MARTPQTLRSLLLVWTPPVIWYGTVLDRRVRILSRVGATSLPGTRPRRGSCSRIGPATSAVVPRAVSRREPSQCASSSGEAHCERQARSMETVAQDEHQVRPATTTTVSHRQQASVTRAPTAPALVAQAYLPCVRERTARDQALTVESHETKKVGLLRDLFCFSNGKGRRARA